MQLQSSAIGPLTPVTLERSTERAILNPEPRAKIRNVAAQIINLKLVNLQSPESRATTVRFSALLRPTGEATVAARDTFAGSPGFRRVFCVFVGVSCWVQDLPGLLLDLRTGFRVLGPSGYRDSGCSHRQHVCVVSVVQRESVCVCVRARVRACVRTRTQ